MRFTEKKKILQIDNREKTDKQELKNGRNGMPKHKKEKYGNT